MSRAERPVLLVGGVPGLEVEGVLNTVAPILGDQLIGLTDGEVGGRRLWVVYLAHTLWANHPDVELIRESVGVPPEALPEGFLPPDWLHTVPNGYEDLRWFAPRQKGSELATKGQTTTYPAHAASSYQSFCGLRDKGVIPDGLRFQVSIPYPDDAVRVFTNDADAMDTMVDAYIKIVQNDIATLCDMIPHEDLLVQWDVNWETVAIEHGDHIPDAPPMQFKANGEPLDRYLRYIQELNGVVPEDVPLGMHLCYGDLHHKHFRDPEDLRASVEMANHGIAASPRKIDYFHFAVPRHRNDDAYFEPMEDLAIGDSTIYAGLVHYTDGVRGSVARLDAMKRHYDGPLGVATECGLGRRPMDQELVQLLEIHRDVAAAI